MSHFCSDRSSKLKDLMDKEADEDSPVRADFRIKGKESVFTHDANPYRRDPDRLKNWKKFRKEQFK